MTKYFSLEEISDFYDQKYHCLEEHEVFIVKALNYFEDTEAEEMRPMLVNYNWPQIKHFHRPSETRWRNSGDRVKTLTNDLVSIIIETRRYLYEENRNCMVSAAFDTLESGKLILSSRIWLKN